MATKPDRYADRTRDVDRGRFAGFELFPFQKAIEKIGVKTEPYKKLINYYSNYSDEPKYGSPETIAKELDRTYVFGFNENEIKYLEALINVLPKEMRLVIEQAGEEISLLGQVNLIPILKEAESLFLSSDFENKVVRQNIINDLGGVRNKLIAGYVEAEFQKAKTGLTPEQLASFNPDEIRNQIKATVTNPTYIPVVGQEFSTLQEPDMASGEIAVGSGTSADDPLSAITGNMPGDFQFNFSDEEIDISEYLRLNPTLNDLGQIAQQYDQPMFEMGSWDKLLNPGKRFVGEDVEGKSTMWTAKDAINFLFNLEEQGQTKKIEEVQNILKKGGYFAAIGEDGSTVFPISGVLDESTVKAWNIFLTDAARSNRNPQAHYLFKLKQMQNIRYGETELPPIDDPAAARSLIQQLAERALGRGISEQDVNGLFKVIDGWRREQLTLGFSGADPGDVDFNARIEDYIKTSNQRELELNSLYAGKSYYDKLFGE